tara:strand:- start:58060 stop:60927 length:2868 start_codon:yes stop_codon:yes gene_type:complete
MSKNSKQPDYSDAFFSTNALFIEDLYESWLIDPLNVNKGWREQFEKLKIISEKSEYQSSMKHKKIKQDLIKENKSSFIGRENSLAQINEVSENQVKVLRLINAFRVRGHQAANLDPLKLSRPFHPPDLDPLNYGFNKDSMAQLFNTGSLFAPDKLPLSEIIEIIQKVYTDSVGSEYMHITDTSEKRWIQQRLETYRGKPELNEENKKWLLHLLVAAENIEKFMHKRFVGQKRFSLEGGEALIPLLDELLARACKNDCKEVVIGMAHRGRLNVLANIMGKPPSEIFQEFTGDRPNQSQEEIISSGDVKYHMGFASDLCFEDKKIHVSLGFNPSHLEIITPVVIGSVRARQQRYKDKNGKSIIPIVIHGDAAFSGQGVNMETLNMSQARGYSVGGTVHIVVNNQIGFTTSNTLDSRSTYYCTDVAKMVQAPIFHVNADDPEAVLFIARLAFDYRMQFKKDVVIDLVCYRRQGHNEADEPAVTQPLMYSVIRNQTSVIKKYSKKIINEGIITQQEFIKKSNGINAAFENGYCVGRETELIKGGKNKVNWTKYKGKKWDEVVAYSIDERKILELSQKILKVPENFSPHPRLNKIIENRRKMSVGEVPLDWGYAETLAYAYLISNNFSVRISGQDSRRGTFFHRHAIWRDQNNGESYTPLCNLGADQKEFSIIDSVLSEEAVLAFEYGYSTAEPTSLVIWEAQYGDFANGAQVVIDQFIASAGAKWGLYCGLTLMLPHGYEGQGPEHSSARIERYMQLCAEHNIQVCMPTSPAQIFHLLVRQMIRPYKRPLIIFTPKSLLRNKNACSSIDDLSNEKFKNIIDDNAISNKLEISQIILCSGKIYYDLIKARKEKGITNVAIIRIEQLYPFPKLDFINVIKLYKNVKKFIWCQEEPQNQGAWHQIKHRFNFIYELGFKVFYSGRKSAAAPATGYSKIHHEEQEEIINNSLNGKIDTTMRDRG